MAFISKDTRDGILYEYYKGTDGKRKRRSLGIKTFSPLLFDFRDKVLEYAKAFHSFGTFQLYETTFKYFCEQLGNAPIDSITPFQIETFKISRLKKVSPSTVNIYLRNLKASFNHAITWGLLTKNPANGIKKLREYQVERQIFKPDEIQRLLAVVDYKPLYKLIVVALYTGCRLSELLHLQYCDIDWLENSFIIRNKASFTTKSGKVRRIPISIKIPFEWLQSENQQDYIFRNCKEKQNKKDYNMFPQDQSGPQKKILLVEDDDALASVYLARLEAEGFSMQRVPNGEEALAKALEFRPDLILLDAMMPKVSGFDVLDILRNTPETTNMRIIMLTALSQESDIQRAKALGVDEYLVKSQVVIADVVERIKVHLNMV